MEKSLNKSLPDLRQRGNRFVLSFRNRELVSLFLTTFKFSSGDKSKTIDIPQFYKDTELERSFWQGYLDGDGSIARNSRRIAVESMSNKIMLSFAIYLNKNKINFSSYNSKRFNEFSHVILIRSVSFRDFAEKVGFLHPLKVRLLKEKLKDRDFFTKNEINPAILNKKVDYTLLFDDSVFLENGRELLTKYGYTKYHRKNASMQKIVSLMKKNGLDNEGILKIITQYRFKKSKGSIHSVRLPLSIGKDIIRISKFVRIRDGGITFSKRYVESFNEDFDEILNLTENTFDLKPKFTSKNEPLFCSGVLSDFFNKIIKRVDDS